MEFLLTIRSFSTIGSFHKNCVFLLRRNSKSDRFHRLCLVPLLLICALTPTMATSAPVNALTPEEQAVLVPIQDFFDGIAKAVDFGQLNSRLETKRKQAFLTGVRLPCQN